MPLIIPANTISGGYEVANSVRLNDGSSDGFSLSGQNGNRQTFTHSFWVKRSKVGAESCLFYSRINSNNHFLIRFTGSDQLELVNRVSGSNNYFVTTNRKFRDVSAYYHILVQIDTTQGTSGNRIKFYVNGVQETSFATQTIGSQSANMSTNYNTATLYVGQEYTSGYNFFDGYMAEVILVDGQALDPTSFGEFDEDTGIWKPIDVSGLTFGTNGFYLDFENSGSLGADVSGNGNNFTVNNLTAIDQTTDTCTNNFATGNPLDYSGTAPTLGNGNLSITSAELSDKPFRTTIAVSQGKWYMEYKCEKSGSDNDNHIGLWSAENSLTSNYVGYQLYSWGIFTANGNKRNNQSYDSYGSAIAQNDIVMIALDKDNGKIWWGKNGTWFASGNPATGSNEAFSNINTVVGSDGFVSFCFLPQQKFSLNFGNPPYSISSGNSDGNGYGNFEYAVPSGYYALNTKNLAEYG